MKSLCVALKSIEVVEKFVHAVSHIEGEVLLSDGEYVINVKSIMGIFSLCLSNNLNLEIKNWKEEYIALLEEYLSE